jgi:hypothetical protein
MALELSSRPRHATKDLHDPHRRRAARGGERPHDPGHHLRPRPEPGRHAIGRQRVIIAEGLGGDLRIGGAADVEQQARIVDLRGRLRVDAQPLAEPHGDQRALQAVLEGHPDPEVRGQRQRRDHLSGTDPFPALECHLCNQSLALLGSIVVHYARTWHWKALASRRRVPPSAMATVLAAR